jgi:hypothetical protein
MDDAPATILKRFKAIEDIHVRRGVLRTALAAMAPDVLGDFVGHLCRRMPDPQHKALWLDVALALVEAPGDDGARVDAVLARLCRHPHRPVFAFLETPPDVRRAGGGTRETPYDLEDVPLGVRKTRARGRSRDVLRVLCDDPEPPVIRILLENPLLVESDVLRIASLRPQTVGTFVEVARSTRFGLRDPVIAAVVLNPYCPTRVAAALVPLLPRAVLREVAGLAGLDAPVRAAAAALLGDATD